MGVEQEKLNESKERANNALAALARQEITINDEETHVPEFGELSENEQKQIIKKKITNEINSQIREYLAQTTTFDYENAFQSFLTWLLPTKK